jgi:rhodanese-related sulfurtransferase
MNPVKPNKKHSALHNILTICLFICSCINTPVCANPLISVEKAVKMMEAEQSILIDTRNPISYAKAWIPGSLNIPVHFIKNKPWLQKRQVILLNEGFAIQSLITTANQLNISNFDIKVLAGGILSWQQKGQQVDGDYFAVQEYRLISTDKLFAEKESTPYLIVNATKDFTKLSKTLFPTSPCINRSPLFIEEINGLTKSHSPTALLLLIDTTPKQSLIKKLASSIPVPVFYLKDGMTGIKQYQTDLAALQRPLKDRIKRSGTCIPCQNDEKSNQ